MTLTTLLFWGVCFFTLTGASVCVFAHKLLHAAFGLGLTLLGVAALYLFLQAEYLAAVQVLVYVGGVLTLVIFGVQLSRDPLNTEPASRTGPWHWVLGICGAAMVLLGVVQLAARTVTYAESAPKAAAMDDGQVDPLKVSRSTPEEYQSMVAVPADKLTNPDAKPKLKLVGANVGSLGDLLIGAYLIPFLALAMLLTAVLIGAVALVRDSDRGTSVAKEVAHE